MKTHLYNNETLALAPHDVKMDYLRKGFNGTLCEYVGITTVLEWRVDCKRCLRKMRNNGQELTKEQAVFLGESAQ